MRIKYRKRIDIENQKNIIVQRLFSLLFFMILFFLLSFQSVLAQDAQIVDKKDAISAENTLQSSNNTVKEIEKTVIDNPDKKTSPAALPFHAPINVIAKDVPNDSGGKIKISWDYPKNISKPDNYIIERKAIDGKEFKELSKIISLNSSYEDNSTKDGIKYIYRVSSLKDGKILHSVLTKPVFSKDHWFNWARFNVFISSLIISFFIILFIQIARSGRELYIRRIAGLSAVEEAIGRATEMGKPILFVPGTGYIEDVATIASLNLLSEITRRIATYNVRMICPNFDPIVFTVAREIVKETYSAEGRPEYYNPDSVFFVVNNQFAYAAAVDGIMLREKPATNFFMGIFGAESLILAETGAMTGAIQIAGTDQISQLPFFITACDYTLIGEELYASSAYLSKDILLLGTLKGQDYSKLLIIIALFVLSLINIFWPDLNILSFFKTGGV